MQDTTDAGYNRCRIQDSETLGDELTELHNGARPVCVRNVYLCLPVRVRTQTGVHADRHRQINRAMSGFQVRFRRVEFIETIGRRSMDPAIYRGASMHIITGFPTKCPPL
jgi:hypothetical protein